MSISELTPWNSESLIIVQLVVNSQPFMGPRGLPLFSQEFAIFPYPKPDNPVHILMSISETHFNISSQCSHPNYISFYINAKFSLCLIN
jgi:hypothetical protein